MKQPDGKQSEQKDDNRERRKEVQAREEESSKATTSVVCAIVPSLLTEKLKSLSDETKESKLCDQRRHGNPIVAKAKTHSRERQKAMELLWAYVTKNRAIGYCLIGTV